MNFNFEDIELTNKYFRYIMCKDYIMAIEKDTNRLFKFDNLNRKFNEEKSLSYMWILDSVLSNNYEMCTHDDKLIFVIGFSDKNPYNIKIVMCNQDFSDYKELTNNCMVRNYPKPRTSYFSVVYNNYLYMGFGYDVSLRAPLNDIWRYDLINKEWTKLEYTSDDIILPRYASSCVLVNDNIYIFGGEDFKINKVRLNEVLVYNITSNYLRKIQMPKHINLGIAGSSCDYYNSHIYIHGGLVLDEFNNKKSNFFNNIIRFNIHSEKLEMCCLNNNTKNSYRDCLKIINGQMYVFPNGIRNCSNLMVIKLDDSKNQMEQKNKMLSSKQQLIYCDLSFILNNGK